MAILVASPYAIFKTRGLEYKADVYGLITVTSPPDIQDLISAGCVALASCTAAEGGVPLTRAAAGLPLTWTTNPAGTGITVSDTSLGISFVDPVGQGADNINSITVAAPTPPYTINAKVGMTTNWLSSDAYAGITLVAPSLSNYCMTLGIVAAQITQPAPGAYVIGYSNPTTFDTIQRGGVITYSPTVWLRFNHDGTNWNFYYSQDGVHFPLIYTVAQNTAFTKIGLFHSSHASYAASNFSAYSVTTP